jgi:hypothetical protein
MLLVLHKLDQESSLIWLRLSRTAKICGYCQDVYKRCADIFGQAKQYEPWLLPAPGQI